MTDRHLPSLGIIMLDTRFERPPGDVGNARTWPFPTLFHTVNGASVRKVVGGDDSDLLDAFVAAGAALVRRGSDGHQVVPTQGIGVVGYHADPLSVG